MKQKRQAKILEIVDAFDVETQEELCLRLVDAGFRVTQATVSRDIRELKLIKVAGAGGRSVYRTVKNSLDHLEKYLEVLRSGFVSSDTAEGIAIVRTVSGMAMAVAAAIDAMDHSEIVGCIAGDDTIMVATRTKKGAEEVIAQIREITAG